MTSQKAFCTIALGFMGLFFLTGCPWSSSANVFDGAKGMALPDFNGPPAQSEPSVTEEFPTESTALELPRSEKDFE